MTSLQRLLLRILLWLAGLMILAVLALLISMQYSISKHGDGEMVDSIALLFGLMIIGYYTVVLVLGRIMLRRGGASWGWLFVAVMLVLVVVPVTLIWSRYVG